MILYQMPMFLAQSYEYVMCSVNHTKETLKCVLSTEIFDIMSLKSKTIIKVVKEDSQSSG